MLAKQTQEQLEHKIAELEDDPIVTIVVAGTDGNKHRDGRIKLRPVDDAGREL